MYLALLKQNEKENFLKLAVALSSVDGNFCEEEHFMISQYCDEMGIDNHIPNDIEKDFIINNIANDSSEQNKKIIIFELLGLAMSDKNFAEAEETLIISLAEKLDLNADYVASCKEMITKYLELQTQINNYIIG